MYFFKIYKNHRVFLDPFEYLGRAIPNTHFDHNHRSLTPAAAAATFQQDEREFAAEHLLASSRVVVRSKLVAAEGEGEGEEERMVRIIRLLSGGGVDDDFIVVVNIQHHRAVLPFSFGNGTETKREKLRNGTRRIMGRGNRAKSKTFAAHEK